MDIPPFENPPGLRPDQIEVLLRDAVYAMIVTTPEGKVVYLNRAAKNLYGFHKLDARRAEGRDLQEYVRSTFDLTSMSGDEVPEEEQPLTRALHGESYRDVELRVRHRESGEERVFAFSGTRIEGSTPLGVLNVRDVTKRHQAERRYRISFETNPAPTLIARLGDGLLMDVNEGFEELTGIAKEAAEGLSLLDLGLLPEGADLREVVADLKLGRMVHQRETTIERAKSGLRDVMVSARPIELEGQPCGIFTFVDITEMREAQRRLQETAAELLDLNNELDVFNHGVSHNLRTPLRGIDGFSQALLEEYGERLDPQGRQYLERVRAAARTLARLIDSLQALQRAARGSMEPTTVDLGKLAADTAEALQTAEPDRKVRFDITSGLWVEGDRSMLRVLVANLLENAWKFTRGNQRARIEVGSRHRAGEIIYFVSDNGVGFDPAYSNKLFEPFQRLHSPADFGGQGVGLAAARRIVTRHRGRIWVEGDVDKGATFYFTLAPPAS